MDALLLLKASLVLSIALIAARLLRRGAAAVRHGLWTITFAALLALPALVLALPALYLPLPAAWSGIAAPGVDSSVTPSSAVGRPGDRAPDRERTAVDTETRGVPPVTAGDEPPAADVRWFAGQPVIAILPAVRLLLLAWIAGSIGAAGALVLSLLRARRVSHAARPLDDAAWTHDAGAIGARLGLRRPARLLVSGCVRTPMAGGIWRPVVYLPASAPGWSAERRAIVLAHELAHLAGLDPLRHLAARLAMALYWFHPLAWIAARESSVAREQACDEAVLALGTRPSSYAQVLLDLADSLHAPAPPLAALPMVERSLLETRLMAILDYHTRPARQRRALIPVIGVALLTAVVAASQPDTGVQRTSRAGRVATRPIDESPAARASAAPVVALEAVPAAFAAPGQTRADSACAWDLGSGSSFSGTLSTTRAGGRTIINQQVGVRGAGRVIQQRFGDLRVCMIAEDVDPAATPDRPSGWIGRARHVIMEARRGNAVQQLEIDRESGGASRSTWRSDGDARSLDAAAEQWRDRMLAALDATWELSTLRGDVSSLRGEISSLRGEESSLRGEISSLRGEVSSMRGRASSVVGDESSLRGEISSLQGEVSSLRGAIASEQGAISSLTAGRYDADAAERARIAASVKTHDDEIARLEREIRDFDVAKKIDAIEKQIRALDANGKVAAIDAEIRAFDLDGKTAAIEKQIAALDVDGKVAAIEKQIAALDADRRGRELEDRRDEAIKRLDAAIAAIR